MPDFSQRAVAAEMMDDFSLPAGTIHPIMDELETINAKLGGHRVFFDAFDRVELKDGSHISDWGCGGGDSLRVLSRYFRKRDRKLRFTGVDATESAVSYARLKASDFPEIAFVHADVFSEELTDNQFDVVISSLFTHHFEDGSWIALIRKMLCCARFAVVVNDLHRHWLAYYSIGVLTKLFSRSAMVKHDSQLSVLRGFTRAELQNLLAKAGITHYRLKWMWAFRWQLIIYKEESHAA
jgi:2-polyprenyl-3-methyl-5-hydroxy-6-metoxy-1,4-benzoquinol methylase